MMWKNDTAQTLPQWSPETVLTRRMLFRAHAETASLLVWHIQKLGLALAWFGFYYR